MNKTTTTATDRDPERLALMQAQKAELERDAMQCVRDEQAAEMLFFRQGMLVLRARKSGVYRLDGYETAEAYVRGLLKCSEKSLARRVRIVKVFTEAEYRELLTHKVKPITIEKIARLPDNVRPTVIEIALQSDHNPTVQKVIERWQRMKEQVALATVGKPAPVGGTPHFSLLIGERDSLHDPAETLRYWSGRNCLSISG